MSRQYGILILAAQLTFCLSASAQDRLEPEEGALNQPQWEWDYAQRLREVLLKDAASDHLARMVCLPSLRSEWVVTVVREDAETVDTGGSYYVEFVGAEKSLFRPEGSQRPTVKKSRAPIDRETAESLNRTWRRMLRTPRYPEEPRIGADGVRYHFSRSLPMLQRGRPDPLAGWEQGKVWSPEEGSVCGELVEIGERLKRYAQAKPQDRDKIRLEIRIKVIELGAKLDRRDQKK